MLTFDSFPQVRVVRERGRQVAPPPQLRRRARTAVRALVRDGVASVFEMWPLTAALLFALGMMWISSFANTGL